jgi:hypothetical protein
MLCRLAVEAEVPIGDTCCDTAEIAVCSTRNLLCSGPGHKGRARCNACGRLHLREPSCEMGLMHATARPTNRLSFCLRNCPDRKVDPDRAFQIDNGPTITNAMPRRDATLSWRLAGVHQGQLKDKRLSSVAHGTEQCGLNGSGMNKIV